MAGPKVAIVCRQVAGVTGTTTTVLEHARRLAALGWEVHVLGERLDEDRLRRAGAVPRRVARFPWGSRLKRRLFDWQAGRALDRGAYDLVWGHGDNLRQDVLSLHNCVHAAHLAVHGAPLPSSSGDGWLHARILGEKRFRLLIANSALMMDDVASRFGVDPARVEVIHPGYDPGRFHPRPRAPRRDEEFRVGLITSGDFAKRGVALFLRALGRLAPEVRGRLRVLVVGQETRLAPYRELARASGLAERVEFLPPAPDVERFYHALDVYVHPALWEEFGQSVQEAMACGVCTLTSRRVGAAELLGPAGRDMLLERPDEEALAAALGRLALDGGLRRRWAELQAAAVRGNTWDENFRRTLEACRRLLP